MSFPRSISLQVREVTSVSVTFALRISLDDLSDLSYTLVDDESDPDETGPAISDALRRGLAVKVNGNNWKRVVVQVDEDEEEAIVIVYGLQSRRKYEVSLTLVVSDESLAENVTTLSPGPSLSMSTNPTVSHGPDPAISPSTLTPPTTPIRTSPPRILTAEERASQLRKQLSLINAEREDFASQLKQSRRESQRTETLLKGEIETLKRASEKHASGEHRSRQKVLALQEAVKQANAAAEELEEMAKSIEETFPALELQAQRAQATRDTVKADVDKTCGQLDAAMNRDSKVIQELQGELTSVCSKLERVTAKRDKLEKETVPQLEERLREVRRDLEQVQSSSVGVDDGYIEDDSAAYFRGWLPPIQRPSPQSHSSVITMANPGNPREARNAFGPWMAQANRQ